MSKLRAKLAKKYKKFFTNNFYASCGDGWLPILEEFFDFIDQAGRQWTIYDPLVPEIAPKNRTFTVDDIKEKFGSLRIYYHTNNKTMDEFADTLIEWAEWKSCKTCEVCGKPGKINKGPWYKVRCVSCK